jgi:hypothetical protein
MLMCVAALLEKHCLTRCLDLFHRLNMELDLQVYLGSMCTAVLIG